MSFLCRPLLCTHQGKATEGHSEQTVIGKPRWEPSPDTEYASPLTLDFPVIRTVKNKCLSFKSPVCGILLQ